MNANLPVELHDNIIRLISAERQHGEDHSPVNLQTLRSLALICKRFSYLCQPHIFKHINLGGVSPLKHDGSPLDTNDQTMEMKQVIQRRLKNLVVAIEVHPRISTWVEELIMSNHNSYGTGTSKSKHERAQHYLNRLTTFSKLKLLGIRSTNDPEDDMVSWDTVFNHIIHAYCSQQTLETLHVTGLYSLPWAAVLSNPRMRTLDVSRSPRISIPMTHFPTSTITTLRYCKEMEFPLSMLLALPCLESLNLNAHLVKRTSGDDDRVPSSNLKAITLRMARGAMVNILDLYFDRVKCAPFQYIQRIEVALFEEREAVALCRALEQVISLQELIIDGMRYSSGHFPFSILNLEKVVRSCARLDFKFEAASDPRSGRSTSVNELTSLITSMRNNNVIQSISIRTVTQVNRHTYTTSFDAWSQLPRILSNAEDFPLLRKVQWRTDLFPGNGMGWGEPGVLDAMQKQLTEYMYPLKERTEVEQEVLLAWSQR